MPAYCHFYPLRGREGEGGDVTPTSNVEEGCVEVTVGEDHRECTRKHGDAQDDDDGLAKGSPGKEWHLMQAHTRCTHHDKGSDDVDGQLVN